MLDTPTDLLRLMQLADSALPIGAAAHSFGLETLAVEGTLLPQAVESFVRDLLVEAGRLEGLFCRAAYRLASTATMTTFEGAWLDLNQRLSALKPGRESRDASARLGRRLLLLMLSLEQEQLCFRWAIRAAERSQTDIHHASAFGLCGGVLGLDEDATTLAYLQQTTTSLIVACQKLMPLGQTQAAQLLWRLKPALVAAAEASVCDSIDLDAAYLFAPLVDLASMRHTTLATRLFMS